LFVPCRWCRCHRQQPPCMPTTCLHRQRRQCELPRLVSVCIAYHLSIISPSSSSPSSARVPPVNRAVHPHAWRMMYSPRAALLAQQHDASCVPLSYFCASSCSSSLVVLHCILNQPTVFGMCLLHSIVKAVLPPLYRTLVRLMPLANRVFKSSRKLVVSTLPPRHLFWMA
jgi:hypothetical protein